MTFTKTLPVALAAALSLASSAFAASPLNNGADPAAARAKGVQQMSSGASLAVLYSPFVGILRAKNVAAVTSPTTGIYCVTPSVARPLTKYQTVSVEWGWSSGNSLLAMVRDTADGYTSCGADDYEVRTFDLTGNPSSAVAFYFGTN